MSQRWLSLWVHAALLTALLGESPTSTARAQAPEADAPAGDEVPSDPPVALEPGEIEGGRVDSAPSSPNSERAAERAVVPVEGELEDPEWDTGEDHPAHLEHVADVAPQPEPGPAPDSSDGESGETPRAPSERYVAPTLLELGASAGLLYHRLSYRDDLYGFMRPYGLASAKQLGGYLTAYPLARADMGVLGSVGVELRYAQMLTFDSARADDSTFFPTRARELIAGFRYRFDCDTLRDRGIDASVGVGGGSQVFDIGSAVALPNVDNRAAVPSRHYRFFRFDAATRVALDVGFFLSMHIGARLVFDAGDVDSARWFPNGRRWGLESGLHLGYVLPKDIELSVGFGAQRYMFRLRPQPGDSNIVGGLLDRYVTAQVRVGWRY